MCIAELKGITADTLLSMEPEALQELYEKVQALKAFEAYNRVDYFKPFPYQKTFMDAGKNNTVRFLMAGNRTGKTYGTSAEFSYHLTGRYPDWWDGLRVADSGHTYWALGVNLDSICRIVQKELLGTSNAALLDEIGTGTIPKQCIDLERGLQRDGMRVKQIRIFHTDGGYNTLMFYNYDNEAAMMGQKVMGAWMDEEPEFYSIDIYSQIRTRILNAGGEGRDGFIIITATPENGPTPLVNLFRNDKSGLLYLQKASMDDNPTLTLKQIEDMLATVAPWQRAMRRNGEPVQGKGAVFEFNEDDYVIDDIQPQAHWQAIAAVDWGVAIDPTALVITLKDPDSETYYVYDTFFFDEDAYDRSPKNVAKALLESDYKAIPVIRPHDHPSESSQLKSYGINVQIDPFRNPPESQLTIKRLGTNTTRAANDIETGIAEWCNLLRNGKLKILRRNEQLLEEMRSHSYKTNRNSNKVERTKPDDTIDATRYSLMSLMANRGTEYGNVNDLFNSQFQSFNNTTFNI